MTIDFMKAFRSTTGTWCDLLVSGILSLGVTGVLACGEPGNDQPLDPQNDRSSVRDREVERATTHAFKFYGKIIDQYGGAVVGAKCQLKYSRIRARQGFAVAASDESESLSDDTGSFQLAEKNGYLFVVGASCPGYIIDDRNLTYNYLLARTIPFDKLSSKETPYVIYAWKLGAPTENRKIVINRDCNEIKLKISDGRELYAKLHVNIEGVGNARVMRGDPELSWVGAEDEWDIALSVVVGSEATGAPPVISENHKKLSAGTGIHVRARSGGIRQTEMRFPFLSGRVADYKSALDLRWSESIFSSNAIHFRILHRNETNSYRSFISLRCVIANTRDGWDFALGFDDAIPSPVSETGVISLLDSDESLLEYFPEHVNRLDSLGRERKNRERLIRVHKLQEDDLLEIRKNDPDLAREIEARMRSEGKTVPP